MDQIGIFDAKTRFSQIIEQVNRTGQSILVTNRGKPVAEISPVRAQPDGKMTREEAFEAVAQLHKEVPPATKEEIHDLINEGRDRWHDA